MVLDTEFPHARHKALAVDLALIPDEMGVRRPQNDIHRVWTALQDQGHGVDHDFDALAGRKKAERQDDWLAAEAEPGLRLVRLDEGKVGNTVRNDLNLFRRNPVYVTQQPAAFFRHDDDPRRRIHDPVQNIAVCRCRLGKNRMQRRDDRHGQP